MRVVTTRHGSRSHIGKPEDEEGISVAVNHHALDARHRLGFTYCGMMVRNTAAVKETEYPFVQSLLKPFCARCKTLYEGEMNR